MPAIPNDRVDALRQNLRGTVLTPTDAGYDAARTIWNAMCDKRPALMVQCAGVADVVAAVNFARDNGLQLAVRGGGHNIAGSALCNDGLVIDFSRMRSVQINLATRRAYVEPGATRTCSGRTRTSPRPADPEHPLHHDLLPGGRTSRMPARPWAFHPDAVTAVRMAPGRKAVFPFAWQGRLPLHLATPLATARIGDAS